MLQDLAHLDIEAVKIQQGEAAALQLSNGTYYFVEIRDGLRSEDVKSFADLSEFFVGTFQKITRRFFDEFIGEIDEDPPFTWDPEGEEDHC